MGQIWGTGANRGWDGGIFGLLTWSFTMLAGTLCYDLISGPDAKQRIRNLLRWGVMFLAIGYGMSCLQTFYDIPQTEDSNEQHVPFAADQQISNTHGIDKGGLQFQLAASPVIPDLSAAWRSRESTSKCRQFSGRPGVTRNQNTFATRIELSFYIGGNHWSFLCQFGCRLLSSVKTQNSRPFFVNDLPFKVRFHDSD